VNTEPTDISSRQDVGYPPDEEVVPPVEQAVSRPPEPQRVENSGPEAGSAQNAAPEAAGGEPMREPLATTSTANREGANREAQSHGGPDASIDGDSDMGGDDDLLLATDTRADFSRRWKEIQANFVDQPQGSVQDADVLVVEIMQRVTGGLSKERERLESQWRQGDDVSTEDLRVALTHYRSFFDRLLSA
jgi:hypothetical protein